MSSKGSIRNEVVLLDISGESCDNSDVTQIEEEDESCTPKLGLGSTANENIALRQNLQEQGLLIRKKRSLGSERDYVMKVIDMYMKNVQVEYKRLSKRVSRIKSNFSEEEKRALENDIAASKFANKYLNLIGAPMKSTDPGELKQMSRLEPIEEESGNQCINQSRSEEHRGDTDAYRPQQKSRLSSSSSSLPVQSRESSTGFSDGGDSDGVLTQILPSFEELVNQIHNIKPQQFYDNQRKLKLYDIQLYQEELDTRKASFFKSVRHTILGTDEDDEENNEDQEKEEEKPIERKTSFMRSVIRNFSMELMMKTAQHGWADMGKCRYLRKSAYSEEEEDGTGTDTLAKDVKKLGSCDAQMVQHQNTNEMKMNDGFTADGKLIRTADLLGLTSHDSDE